MALAITGAATLANPLGALESPGASLVERTDVDIEMADPDGNEFRVRAE